MKYFLLCSGMVILVGCDLSPTGPSEHQAPPKVKSLALAGTDQSLELFLKTGLESYYAINLEPLPDDLVFASEDSSEAVSADAQQTSPASETNTIIDGVDEADWLKYNASSQHLFIAVQPQWTDGGWDNEPMQEATLSKGQLEVFSLAESGHHTHVGRYQFDENANWIHGLYSASEDQLIALYAKSESYSAWWSWQYWRSGKVGIEAVNVSQANAPVKDWNITIDGYLIDSRRIGDSLYVVTQFSPSLPGLQYNPWNKDVVEKNKTLIRDASLADLVPTIRINGDAQPLIPSHRCYLPAEQEWQGHGYANLISITRINLATPADWKSSCAIVPAWQIALSDESLYLIRGYDWQQSRTEMHRFTLNDSLDYTDSVTLPGSLGWVSNKFRVKEQTMNNRRVLTAITSNLQENGDWQHGLHNYQVTDNGQIEHLASLPNEASPEPIGKPGENIHGARIDGTTAYVVTFETIDPLYKIDLTDPAQPKTLGQLEIPGFSDYLHPVDGNLLIGVGYQMPETGGRRQVKVSLYDVSGDTPSLVSEDLVGSTEGWNNTPVNWSHHAFTSLDAGNGVYRFTVPVNTSNWAGNQYESKGILKLYELDLYNPTSNDLTQSDSIQLDLSEYYWIGDSRSVLVGDSVHLAYRNLLISSLWSTPNEVQRSSFGNTID